MMRKFYVFSFSKLFLVYALFISASIAADRPNVLWITSEDNSPYLGCYGDPLASTPNLDRLAQEGVRYRNAFANAPVCSVARTTLITGMYATTIGGHNHRSSVAMPSQFKLYVEHLRAAGYYCTNNSKTDYNFPGKQKIWDENGNKASYDSRQPNQPFFAVHNLTASHESQVAAKGDKFDFRIAPEKIQLPPYHPDTITIRRDWANYYDQMTLMDQQVGQLLAKLERDGLSNDTIVFYYSDHGGALPRGKRNIHDSGTRVPLILKFPPKWSKLAPAAAGQWANDLVSFVDFPSTLLSICDVKIPEYYQGRPFAGAARLAPRDHVLLYRGRMDERYDTVRAVRDREYRYIRNYSPHRPYGQQYSYPFKVLPSMKSWYDEFLAGRCNEAQSSYWKAKPAEEFYAIGSDPFELANLIAAPQHSVTIQKMRALLRAEIVATRDIGFIPEGMFVPLAGSKTIYEYAQSEAYPLEQILSLADIASDGDPRNLPALADGLDSPHPIMRYWAATGCLILKEKASPVASQLKKLLSDHSLDVRVIAAESIGVLGEADAASATLQGVLELGNSYEVLAALNSLDALRTLGILSLSQAQKMVRNLKLSEPADRIAQDILN